MAGREPSDAAVRAFEEAGGDARDPEIGRVVSALGEHAPALLPLVLSDPSIPADVLARSLSRGETERSLRALFLDGTAGLPDGPELYRALRRLRHRAVVRVALREVLRLADIDRTSAELADLAAAALDAALAAGRREEEGRHGPPLDEEARPIPIVALGMGKLGGRELNLGSDIDLCFFYGTDEGTAGDDERTVHEHFARVVRRTTKAMADVTEDGFCFRVDLRLRPEGTTGPLVNSLASAERYYESWGRTWERGALLRARPIAGDLAFGAELLGALAPFVYRRSVNPAIAAEMAEMLLRTRRELEVDEERDVKLGRGGIREAEFIVQSLQLIWGGQHPELRVTHTVEAIRRLRAAGLLTDREADALEADWALLRRIEHRIHMWTGYQTHALPAAGPDRERFARSLGFAEGRALETALRAARDRVAALFASVQPRGDAPPLPRGKLATLADRIAAGATAPELAPLVAAALPVDDPDEAAAHLVRLGRRADSPLGPVGRERSPALGELLLAEVTEAAWPDGALRYLAEFWARMGGPWGYERLLEEEPRLARRLVALFGASATLSAALIGHPEAIDHLLIAKSVPSPAGVAAAHRHRLPSAPSTESFVAALREVKRELVLQIGLAHVAGELDQAGVESLLTALADAQVRAALDHARADVFEALGAPRPAEDATLPAELVVVGLGKLGAAEMGFGSDLDLVFLYGAEGESAAGTTNAELFTRVAQRTLRLLSQPDMAGPGYATDMRLRPDGGHGMLVVSVDAFERYHRERAAGWERQALLRARPVAGEPALADHAGSLLEEIAYGAPISGEEVARLRRRLEEELGREKPRRLHPKVGHGALLDVEFVVQFLQMAHGGTDRAVRARRTLDGLAALAARGHLGAADADALEEGHRFFRSVEQAMKLMDEKAEAVLVPGGPVAERVARRLGLRERDGHPPSVVLSATWQRHASEVRAIFERKVAPVGTEPPWKR